MDAPFRLIATPETVKDTERLARFFEEFDKRLATGMPARLVGDAIRQGYAENFQRENAGDLGPWAPLKPSTIRDRMRKGFGPRPILIRTKRYWSSWVTRTSKDHISRVERRGNEVIWLESSRDYRVKWIEQGTRYMPARPVTFLTRSATNRINRMIESVIRQLAPER